MSGPSQPRLQRRVRVALAEYPVDAAFSPDGRTLLVGDGAGKLQLLDVASSVLQPLGEHAGGVLAVAWQPGGKLVASSGQDGEVRLADTRTRESRLLFKAAGWSERLAFAPQGKLLAVGSGRTLRVHGSDGSERTSPLQQPGAINAMAWRPKGLELATLGNGGARLHRLGSSAGASGSAASVETVEHAHAGACLTASWSPDGRVLASGLQEGSVQFWNIAANTKSQMRGYGTKVGLTSFSANSRLLATGADQAIVVWDFSGGGPEGSEPLQLSTHTARLTQLAFQPQGPLLASGARDHRLALWRPGLSGDPLDADLLAGELALLRWSVDGRWLAAGDSTGQLSVYEVALK
jgi:WD40 repeat protein